MKLTRASDVKPEEVGQLELDAVQAAEVLEKEMFDSSTRYVLVVIGPGHATFITNEEPMHAAIVLEDVRAAVAELAGEWDQEQHAAALVALPPEHPEPPPWDPCDGAPDDEELGGEG